MVFVPETPSDDEQVRKKKKFEREKNEKKKQDKKKMEKEKKDEKLEKKREKEKEKEAQKLAKQKEKEDKKKRRETSISSSHDTSEEDVAQNSEGEKEIDSPEKEVTDSTPQISTNLRPLQEQAETYASQLVQLLTPSSVDPTELGDTLRALGQVSKSVYEDAGDLLTHSQVKQITASTQTMLEEGLLLKRESDSDSPERRKQILQAIATLLQVVNEVTLDQELSLLVPE